MSRIENSSTGSIIYNLLKNKFHTFLVWDVIREDITVMCANIPEVNTDVQRKEIIVKLTKIKTYLIEHDISEKEIILIDEEIDRYQHTEQLSAFNQKDDEIPAEIIDKYARLGYGTEGIVGIHLAYNYDQLRKLTLGVFKRTGMVKFYVSKETTVYGKIIAEMYERSQKIPIATLLQSKKENKSGEPMHKTISVFGQRWNSQKYDVIKEVTINFFVYRFLTDRGNDLVLLSTKQLEIGDYICTGVTVDCSDNKTISESASLPTRLPFMFAQSCVNRIIKFAGHEDFRNRLLSLEVTRKNLFNLPFTVRVGKKQHVLKHPAWYMDLIWSWLCHAPIGLFNNYPLHLMIVGIRHSGKSLLINSLHARLQETRKIFSGSSSTLKHLIPSFKYRPAQLGYLAESNRFAFLDEFLRCLLRGNRGAQELGVEEGVALMNDLLEHQKREAGSGVSRANINMTSRALATTNPVRGVKNMDGLLKTFDTSFLSRWLIYYQTEDHVRLVQESTDAELPLHEYVMEDSDLISILDYLHSFKSEYSLDKLKKIKQSADSILSFTLKAHYDARHMHHLECLMDGVVKTRCLMTRDIVFKARAEDYDTVRRVWKNIVRSWVSNLNLKDVDVSERVGYLPEDCQWLFNQVCKMKRPLSRFELEEVGLKELKKRRLYECLVILRENGVLLQEDDLVKPFYMEGVEDEFCN